MDILMDGTVRYWDVYRQQWVCKLPDRIPDRDWATLSDEEREGIMAYMERIG